MGMEKSLRASTSVYLAYNACPMEPLPSTRSGGPCPSMPMALDALKYIASSIADRRTKQLFHLFLLIEYEMMREKKEKLEMTMEGLQIENSYAFNFFSKNSKNLWMRHSDSIIKVPTEITQLSSFQRPKSRMKFDSFSFTGKFLRVLLSNFCEIWILQIIIICYVYDCLLYELNDFFIS